MMDDARAGKIDLIITKSITRFARNTDTVLKATRELKELGVGVFFELQNINTLSAEGELLMTVYAAFGQAESDSARENTRMAFERRMREGRPIQALDKCFGYRLAGDGEYLPDQNAKWVVKIYELAADGYTCRQIARYLEENGVKSDRGAIIKSSSIRRAKKCMNSNWTAKAI
jgi:DNA invertase Pin-like site-specific DNA recombinase